MSAHKLNLTVFAERLDGLMFERQIKPPFLAKELTIDKSTVNRYLEGRKIPSLKSIVRLSDYFLCSTDYILGFKEEFAGQTFNMCPLFSEQLQSLMRRFKLKSYQLHRETGISESVIYYWLNGRYDPTVDSIIKLANFFDLSFDFIIGREK